MIHIGQRVWIEPNVRGRIIEITDETVIVQEDHRCQIDGSKEHPIYEFARNINGETHIFRGG